MLHKRFTFTKKNSVDQSYDCSIWHKWMMISILFTFRVNLLPYDLITQMFNILSIETSWEGGKFMLFIVNSYFMPVCSIVQTITPWYHGQPDALLHEASCNSASGRPRHLGTVLLPNPFDEILSSIS